MTAWLNVGIGTTSRKEVQEFKTFRGIWCFSGFPRIFPEFILSPNTLYTRGLLVTLFVSWNLCDLAEFWP